MKLLDGTKEESEGLNIFKDPFKSNKIESVSFFSGKSLFKTIKHTCTIKFENGDTKGEQKIEGQNLYDTIKKAEIFINNLKENP